MKNIYLILLLTWGLLLGLSPLLQASETSDDSEGLSQFEVEHVIQKNINKLKSCFESARSEAAITDGKLLLDFKVNVKGRVKGLIVESTTDAGTPFRKCVSEKIEKWEFPLPRGGMDVEVHYPVLFRIKAPAVANAVPNTSGL